MFLANRAAKESLMWRRFLLEMRKFALVASFLFFFFGAFATYRRLILSEYQIDCFQSGYALVEALVLGKVVLVGEITRAIGLRQAPCSFPPCTKHSHSASWSWSSRCWNTSSGVLFTGKILALSLETLRSMMERTSWRESS